MGKLDGKIALVTGGNSGIGLATAKQFVNEGAYVFITGRREPELARAVQEIGRNVTGVRGDVSNLGDLDRLFAQIKREKGKLDIVFANAGSARFAPLDGITEEHYDALFDSDHPECVHRRQSSDRAGVECVQRHQSRRAFVRADMDDGLEGSTYSRERGEPGLHRYAPMAFPRSRR